MALNRVHFINNKIDMTSSEKAVDCIQAIYEEDEAPLDENNPENVHERQSQELKMVTNKTKSRQKIK